MCVRVGFYYFCSRCLVSGVCVCVGCSLGFVHVGAERTFVVAACRGLRVFLVGLGPALHVGFVALFWFGPARGTDQVLHPLLICASPGLAGSKFGWTELQTLSTDKTVEFW